MNAFVSFYSLLANLEDLLLKQQTDKRHTSIGESDVPRINGMFIIGQLMHHACSSMSPPYALQVFIKPNNIQHHLLQWFCLQGESHSMSQFQSITEVSELTFFSV